MKNFKTTLVSIWNKLNAITQDKKSLFCVTLIYTIALFGNYLLSFILDGLNLNLILAAVFYLGINIMALIFIKNGQIILAIVSIVGVFVWNFIQHITTLWYIHVPLNLNTIINILIDISYIVIIALSFFKSLNKNLLMVSTIIFIIYTISLLALNIINLFAGLNSISLIFKNIVKIALLSQELSLIIIVNIKKDKKNIEKSYKVLRVVGVVLLIICVISFMNRCSSCLNKDNSNPHDGKCDICGRVAVGKYADHEVCGSCWMNMQKNWYENPDNWD